MADKIDWDAIKAEYIAGGISQKELARKHGVTERMVADHSARDGWVQQRTRCRRKAVEKTIDIVAKQKARSLANIMLAADRMADRLAANVAIIDTARDTSDIAKAYTAYRARPSSTGRRWTRRSSKSNGNGWKWKRAGRRRAAIRILYGS